MRIRRMFLPLKLARCTKIFFNNRPRLYYRVRDMKSRDVQRFKSMGCVSLQDVTD